MTNVTGQASDRLTQPLRYRAPRGLSPVWLLQVVHSECPEHNERNEHNERWRNQRGKGEKPGIAKCYETAVLGFAVRPSVRLSYGRVMISST